MKPVKSPWILSARFDTCFILSPAILVALIAAIFSGRWLETDALPAWSWLILIVGIDAGHVYSTLFRTYLVKREWRQRPNLLILTPMLAWFGGCILYNADELVFWRALAYLAVFHFIRQQYGFMMIYSRHECGSRLIDKAAVYIATLYPIVYWHCHSRSFNWFVENDFIRIDAMFLDTLSTALYAGFLSLYVIKEYVLWLTQRTFNLPRNLLLIGTASTWYVGIVAFDNDLIFTATNVIAHGVPYYALIWAYGYQQNNRETDLYIYPWVAKLFRRRSIPGFLGLVFALAFFEEGLWDALVWREHASIFPVFADLPAVHSSQTLNWLVPLLALPQTTHYLLDAFIWRLHRKHTDWKSILF